MQENILIKVGADISNFASNMSKVSKELTGIGGGLDTATKKQKSFVRSISEIASGIGVYAAVSKGISMITNSLDGAISRYDTLNNFPRVLQQIGFSADDSEKAINRLSDGIQGLPTTLDDVAGTAQRLAVMTGDLDGAVETTLALNNAFISSGSDAANAARGLEQYVQMLSRGEVGLEEWRTLQETMGVALNDVAKAFGFAGKSAQNDLYDALKSGEITMEEFNAKLIELNDGTNGFAERAKTASGGIKTAWTNMQTAVVRGVTKIIESIDSVLADTPLESIENIINNIGDAFYNFLDGIAQKIPTVVGLIGELVGAFQEGGLPAVFEQLIQTVSGSIDGIVDIITSNLPTMLEQGRQIMFSIIKGLIEVLPDLLEVGLQLIEAYINIFVESLPEVMDTGTELLLALIDGIEEMLPSLSETALQLVEKVAEIIVNNLPKIIDSGVKMLVSLIEGISDALPQLISTAVKLVVDVAKTIIDNLPEIIAAGVEILLSLIDGILDALPDLLAAGVEILADLSSEMLSAIPDLLGGVGKAIVEGIWAGIKGAGGWLKDKVSGFFSGIVDWGKKALGINSPSRVIRDQVGRWIPAGLVDGINGEKNAVIKAAEQMAQWATPDVPDVAIAYTTPSGLRGSLSSAVSGTVDVSARTRDDRLIAEFRALRHDVARMKIQLDTGVLVGEIHPQYDRYSGNQISLKERWD